MEQPRSWTYSRGYGFAQTFGQDWYRKSEREEGERKRVLRQNPFGAAGVDKSNYGRFFMGGYEKWVLVKLREGSLINGLCLIL